MDVVALARRARVRTLLVPMVMSVGLWFVAGSLVVPAVGWPVLLVPAALMVIAGGWGGGAVGRRDDAAGPGAATKIELTGEDGAPFMPIALDAAFRKTSTNRCFCYTQASD